MSHSGTGVSRAPHGFAHEGAHFNPPPDAWHDRQNRRREFGCVWRQVLLPLNVNYSCRFGRLLVRRRTVRWALLLPLDAVPLVTYSRGYYRMFDMLPAGLVISAVWVVLMTALLIVIGPLVGLL